MTEHYTNSRGNTLVELMMVMTLLILLCVTMATVICAGSEAQNKITDQKDRQIDARTALNYVTAKLRQNDQSETISIEKNPITGENAIVLRDRAAEAYYDTWIYYANNTIYEFIGLAGEPPVIDLSIAILASDGLAYTVDYDEAARLVTHRITYPYGETQEELSMPVHLRAG